MNNTQQATQQVPSRKAAKAAILIGAALTAAVIAGSARPAAAASSTIWVDRDSRGGQCTDQATQAAQATANRPLCTLAKAGQLASPGTTVMIRAGAYTETLAPRVSGTATAPIRFTAAEAGVTIAANGKPAGINLQGVSNLRFTGLTVTGAAKQGVWVANSSKITFTGVTVSRNQGPGIQLKATADVIVELSTVQANLGGGIMELGDVARGRYMTSTITGNGHDGQQFNGDGMILNGTGAIVRGNTITGNGDHILYEHGIYASKTALDYVIEGNQIAGNSATGVKAQGAGIIRTNTFGSSRYGIWVDSSSKTGARITGNTFTGTFLKAIATGTGALVTVSGNTLGAGVI